MKEKILELRAKGLSYLQIKTEVGCSKSTVAYYCGDGQIEKNRIRTNRNRSSDSLKNRVYNFKNRKLKSATRDFQRRNGGKLHNKSKEYSFNYGDVIKKFGVNITCYLSGEKINLLEDTNYELDHIVSMANGGKATLKNLGILHKTANKIKGSLSVEDTLNWCEKILKHNGYTVKRKRPVDRGTRS